MCGVVSMAWDDPLAILRCNEHRRHDRHLLLGCVQLTGQLSQGVRVNGQRVKSQVNARTLLYGLSREGLGEDCLDLGVVDLLVVNMMCVRSERASQMSVMAGTRACAVCVCRRVIWLGIAQIV
jgi:hypothetical protein